jgi:hypothetical protein
LRDGALQSERQRSGVTTTQADAVGHPAGDPRQQIQRRLPRFTSWPPGVGPPWDNLVFGVGHHLVGCVSGGAQLGSAQSTNVALRAAPRPAARTYTHTRLPSDRSASETEAAAARAPVVPKTLPQDMSIETCTCPVPSVAAHHDVLACSRIHALSCSVPNARRDHQVACSQPVDTCSFLSPNAVGL